MNDDWQDILADITYSLRQVADQMSMRSINDLAGLRAEAIVESTGTKLEQLYDAVVASNEARFSSMVDHPAGRNKL